MSEKKSTSVFVIVIFKTYQSFKIKGNLLFERKKCSLLDHCVDASLRTTISPSAIESS